MGSGKGGAQQSTNVYGTVAGVFGWGPLDWIRALIYNGNYLFKNDAGIDLVDDVTDLTGALIDPAMVMAGGYVRLYRGTETQPADPALRGTHRGTIKLVARHLLFGQEAGVPGNFQLIGGRCPRVPTAIVAAVDNVVDDRQVNPIAAFAEYLLDERGAGWAESLLDAPSWRAVAHWCAQNAAHRAVTFVAPLITKDAPLRDIARSFLDPLGAFCRWTRDGKLACHLYEWGVNPGGLPLLDARAWTTKPEFVDGTWDDIPTEVIVAYTDRDYQFQSQSVPVPNAAALKIRGVDDSQQLDLNHVTRRGQAARLGAERVRRLGTAPSQGTLQVRTLLCADLRPGDKVLVDVDPEPGGAGSAQLCRVEKITQDTTDQATIEVMTDGLLAAESYMPDWPAPAIPPEAECPPLVYRQAVPLPLAAFDWPPAVAFLATRSAPDQLGFHVLFSSDPNEPFQDLGPQGGFAVRAALAANLAVGAATANLTELDGLTAPDAVLAAATPGGNPNEAADDKLLVLFASLDEQNRIALDGDLQPIMEFASISERAAVAGATFTYTLLRGRLGTSARAWAAATTIAWIVPRAHLVPFRHGLVPALLGAEIYFRLQSFTSDAADASAPLPAANLRLPALPPPTTLQATPGTGKSIGLKWTPPAATFSGEYAIWRSTNADFSGAIKLGEVTATRFVDVDVAVGVTYYYKVVATSPSEQTSVWSNMASATPSAVATPAVAPANPPPLTFHSSGTYPAAADGTSYGWIRFNVPAFSGEFQTVRYRRQGAAGPGTLADQVQAGATSVTIDDLAPGGVYHVTGQGFNGDQGSGVVEATGSPFTVPTAGAPVAPTGLSVSTSAADLGIIPPCYAVGTRAKYAAGMARWTAPADKSVAYYEIWRTAGVPSQIGRTKGTETTFALYAAIMVNPVTDDLLVYSVNRSGVRSATAATLGQGAYSLSSDYGTGTLALQDASAVTLGTVAATSFDAGSSRRFKRAIRPILRPMPLVRRFVGVTYLDRAGIPGARPGRKIGLISEDTAKFLPAHVSLDEQGRPKGINYAPLVGLCFAALQHQDREIAMLKREVRAIRRAQKKAPRN